MCINDDIKLLREKINDCTTLEQITILQYDIIKFLDILPSDIRQYYGSDFLTRILNKRKSLNNK